MTTKLLTTVAATALAAAAAAQVTTAYDVSGSIGTYTEITGGTVINGLPEREAINETVFGADGNAATAVTAVEGIPIGFDFKFNNELMNCFLIGANGYLVLGRDEITFDNSSENSYNLLGNDAANNIAGLMPRGNAVAMDDTEYSYLVSGEAPNRTLTVQFKNLTTDVGMWSSIYVTSQLQITLHESGVIDVVMDGWNPNDSGMPTYYAIKIGIKGTGADFIVLSGTYTDFVVSHSSTDAISWNDSSYPADGQIYSFTPPADCEKPAEQPTGLVLTSRSTMVEGNFTPTDYADHYLTLVTKGAELTGEPADGVTYAAGDSIGNALVVDYSEDTAFATPEVLEGAELYAIHIMAANSYCMYGPKYLTDAPLTATVTTLPTAPASVVAESAGLDAINISVQPNDNGDRVLVAISTEPEYDEYQQATGNGAFGTPDGGLAAGDEIDEGGTVVYVGEAKDGISVGNLEQNTVYYVKAWSVSANGSCSSDAANGGTATGGTVPYSPDFSKMPLYAVPLGWEADEDGFYLSQQRGGDYFLTCSVTQADVINGVEHSITSP